MQQLKFSPGLFHYDLCLSEAKGRIVKMKKLKLFCLPYAGGSSGIYAKWSRRLDNVVEIIPVELSGRGRRFSEPLYNSLDEAVEDIYKIIEKRIVSSERYAIFGHSLGGLIAYELAQRIRLEGKPQPVHIFFSGTRPPHIKSDTDNTYALSDEEFKNKLTELGGTPEEILGNQELLDVFLPILRADFKINDTYEYTGNKEQLNCGFSVLGGITDNIKQEELAEWRDHTTGRCDIFMLDGGHFFINSHTDEVIRIVENCLEEEEV